MLSSPKIETVSIVVPFYKSKDSVAELHARLASSCANIADELEFVFVEDCGNDGTWEELEKLARDDERVKAVQLSRNFGQHHAITAGLDICTGDWVVVMDCDLQDRPEEIPRLFAKSQEGYDVVCARRGKRKDPFWKKITSRMFVSVFNWLSGMDYDTEVANFRIVSRKVVEAYRVMREGARTLGGQMQWLGFEVGYVDVEHGARHSGRSSYTLGKLVKLATDSIVAFSNKPLRLSIQLGFLISVCALVSAGYIAFRKLFFGVSIDGWASLMVSLWFIGGVIIANLGVIGLYLGKTYDETKRRPLYVISKKINLD